jgi:hypothetical protein
MPLLNIFLGLRMRMHEARAELEELFQKQVETLNTENLGDLPVEELIEYEQRYERIRVLCAEILSRTNLAA